MEKERIEKKIEDAEWSIKYHKRIENELLEELEILKEMMKRCEK